MGARSSFCNDSQKPSIDELCIGVLRPKAPVLHRGMGKCMLKLWLQSSPCMSAR